MTVEPRHVRAIITGSNGTTANINSNGSISVSSLVSEPYDYILLSPEGDANPTSVTYKTGGSAGTIVAVLTLTYSAGELLSVERTT